jgi:hypothetical protein
MVKSKAWDWEKEKNNIWLEPCEESYYYVNKWKNQTTIPCWILVVV